LAGGVWGGGWRGGVHGRGGGGGGGRGRYIHSQSPHANGDKRILDEPLGLHVDFYTAFLGFARSVRQNTGDRLAGKDLNGFQELGRNPHTWSPKMQSKCFFSSV